MQDNSLKKRQKEFAGDLVGLLYSTKKRQQLADWFRKAYNSYKNYNNIKASDASDDIKKIIMKVKGIDNDTVFNGEFVNQHFPCLTGTFTCFMLNGKTHQLLVQDNVVDSCLAKLAPLRNGYLVVNHIVKTSFQV